MRITKYVAGALIVFAAVFTAVFGAAKIAEEREIVKREDYKGIITVWQIDTFEGGTGSRRLFLSDAAKKFSKKNKGLLFLVSTHTVDSAEKNFRDGIYPDIISFGAGLNLPETEELPHDLFFKGGAIGGKVYATPWCRGGYALIKHGRFSSLNMKESKTLSSVIVSQGNYTMPLLAAFSDGYEIEKYEVYTPLDAYKIFTLGKTPYLLGTQRDIIRLKARGENFSFTPLSAFCDLYQYVAVTGAVSEKISAAKSFVEFLLSEDCQSTLKNISMLPIRGDVAADGLELLSEKEPTFTVSAFTPQEKINEINADLKDFFGGDKSLYTKIKNVPF